MPSSPAPPPCLPPPRPGGRVGNCRPWAVAIARYASWAALVWFWDSIPWPVTVPLAAYVLAWHFSLQHEAIHGWRSIPRWLRAAIVWPPIGGWWPFE